MNLSPEIVQSLLYLALVVVGFAIKQFFPHLKLPTTPTPAPIDPAKPAPSLRDQLADILPDLLEQFLRNRLPAQPAPLVQSLAVPAIGSPVAVSVSTPTHNIGVDAAGAVTVAVK